MKIPDPFIFNANGKTYQVAFDIDLYSLSFSIVCPPAIFRDEVIEFYKAISKETEITVRVLVLEKNEVINCFDMVPLLVSIKPFEDMLEPSTKDFKIFLFQQFIDELSASGQLDYLYDEE